MRIALLSDLHGNLFALEAVLLDLASAAVDQIVCLGDVALFGPQPRETLERLRALNCPVIMGNTDAWALAPQPYPVRDENTAILTAIETWGAQQLTAEDITFIRTFQPTVKLELGQNATLYCYHGSPRSYNEAIIATTPDHELTEIFVGCEEAILAGGHTHAQFIRRWQDKFVLNPGSVGLPYEVLPEGVERNPPWAEYAILTWEEGATRIELRRVPYPVQPLIDTALHCGMPHAGWWLKDWSV